MPKSAIAQEVSGSRIIYGNYTQNYSLDPNISIIVDYDNRNTGYSGNFQDGGLPSIKSQRNYQLGFVFGDKYGRETPVTTSTEGAVNIPWGDPNQPNASISHQLVTRLKGTIPQWADYYKVYVKETTNEYYNLVMDRWYNAEDGNIWLSFQSADRNKVDIETYLILKNQHGTEEPVFL